MRLRKNLGIELLAIVIAIGFGFSKGVSPVASQDDMPLFEFLTDWSPDGSQILFASNRSGNFDIWVVNPDGSNMTNLTSGYSSLDAYAFWSPDGKTVAFLSDRESQKLQDDLPNVDLWVMEAHGINPRNLTVDIEKNVESFAWSPDSKYLVFTIYELSSEISARHGEIWTIELATGVKTRIEPILRDNDNLQNYNFSDPVWTLDNKLVFTVEHEQPVGIWVLDLNDEAVLVQVPVEQAIAGIDLSPDGSSTVYTTFLNVILVNIRNGEVVDLVSGLSGVNVDPQWSPDGNKIAFRASNRDFSSIWVVSPDGTGLTNLSADYASFDTWPIWSPSSKQIAFVSNRSGEYNIWVMNADGSNPINLTGKP